VIPRIVEIFKNNKALIFLLFFMGIALVATISNNITQQQSIIQPDTPLSAPTQAPEPSADAIPTEVPDEFDFTPDESLGNILEHSATEAVMLVINRGLSLDEDTPPHARLAIMRPYITDDVYIYFEDRYTKTDWDKVRAEKINVFADIASYEVIDSNLAEGALVRVSVIYEGDSKNLINTKEESLFLIELKRTADFHNWVVSDISPADLE
jgi:hypothetical protein